ncbi:hypothetical protein D3C71_2122000 [compost metagenome]
MHSRKYGWDVVYIIQSISGNKRSRPVGNQIFGGFLKIVGSQGNPAVEQTQVQSKIKLLTGFPGQERIQ